MELSKRRLKEMLESGMPKETLLAKWNEHIEHKRPPASFFGSPPEPERPHEPGQPPEPEQAPAAQQPDAANKGKVEPPVSVEDVFCMLGAIYKDITRNLLMQRMAFAIIVDAFKKELESRLAAGIPKKQILTVWREHLRRGREPELFFDYEFLPVRPAQLPAAANHQTGGGVQA